MEEKPVIPKSQLPSVVRKELQDFVLVGGGTYTAGKITGNDSFSKYIEEKRITVSSFYMDKYEVTVEDYMAFYNETSDTADKPDTLCFFRDFEGFYQKWAEVYYWHPKYRKYPICGVNLSQAKQYCAWKTAKVNAMLKTSNSNLKVVFRLPTVYELEYSMVEDEHYLENYTFNAVTYFKSVNAGNVADTNNLVIKHPGEDGYYWQAPVKSYKPNENGAYNLQGNVAEWTQSTVAGTFYTDTTMDGTDGHNPVRVADTSYYIVKGGSFAHGLYYIQPGAAMPVKSSEQHSWLGFRLVMEITAE